MVGGSDDVGDGGGGNSGADVVEVGLMAAAVFVGGFATVVAGNVVKGGEDAGFAWYCLRWALWRWL